MKLGLITSTWVEHNVGLEEGLRTSKDIGFDFVDFFQDPLEPNAQEQIALAKRLSRELDLPINGVVGVSAGLIDPAVSVRTFHEKRCRAYLEMGHELGAHNSLLVLGSYFWEKQIVPESSQWAWAVEGCQRLGRYAASLGLEIVVEMEPFAHSVIGGADSQRKFLQEVGERAVKANIDISHFHLTKSPASLLTNISDLVGHVHLSDCKGDRHGDLPAGDGDVDFVPYLAGLRSIGFDRAVSIELEYTHQPSLIKNTVKRAYDATDQLFQRVGIRRG